MVPLHLITAVALAALTSVTQLEEMSAVVQEKYVIAEPVLMYAEPLTPPTAVRQAAGFAQEEPILIRYVKATHAIKYATITGMISQAMAIAPVTQLQVWIFQMIALQMLIVME